MKTRMKLMLLAVTMAIVLAAASVSAEYTVDAGEDMVTWIGQPVTLDPTVVDLSDPNNLSPNVTYAWTTNALPAGVTVSFDPGVNVKNPTVTITGPAIPPFAEIAIPNPGFETRWDDGEAFNEGQYKYVKGDVDIWRHYASYSGNGGPVRVGNPAADEFNGDPDAPEGNMCVRVYTRYFDTSYPELTDFEAAVQLLDEPFNPEIDYKLTVKVGNPVGQLYNGYAVQLVAGGEKIEGPQFGKTVYGGTVIAEDYNTMTIAEGDFVEATVLYTANSAGADLAGQPLQIRLLALEDPADHSTTSYVNFDDIKLYAKRIKVEFTLAVDDAVAPTTAVTDSMTIDVYADACKALFYNDPASLDITDVDTDCVTELDDLAVLASAWLDGYALTAPQDK